MKALVRQLFAARSLLSSPTPSGKQAPPKRVGRQWSQWTLYVYHGYAKFNKAESVTWASRDSGSQLSGSILTVRVQLSPKMRNGEDKDCLTKMPVSTGSSNVHLPNWMLLMMAGKLQLPQCGNSRRLCPGEPRTRTYTHRAAQMSR